MTTTSAPPAPILLVEDNADDVLLTQRALKKAQVVNPVVVARDGAEALDWLWCAGAYAGRDPTEQPAVVLLDLKLPRIDGLEVLRRLRAHPRTALLRVVVLTSSKEDADVEEAYKSGANSYIRKPVDFDTFLETVERLGLYWLLLNEAPPRGRP